MQHKQTLLAKPYGINLFKTAIAVSIALTGTFASNLAIAKQHSNKNNTYTCSPLRRTLCNFDYYVGVDAMRRNMHYEKNLGSNFMKKNVPELNIFWGVKFNEYFGLELGYGVSETKNSKTVAKYGDKILGHGTTNNNIDIYHSVKYKRNSLSVKITGYSPEYNCFKMFASIGISVNKHKYTHTHQAYDNLFRVFLGDPVKDKLSANNSRSARPQIDVGAIYRSPTHNFGVKVLASWSKENRSYAGSFRQGRYKANPKSNLAYGIGILYFI